MIWALLHEDGFSFGLEPSKSVYLTVEPCYHEPSLENGHFVRDNKVSRDFVAVPCIMAKWGMTRGELLRDCS